MGFFPHTPAFTNMSFVDSPDPLTGHRYFLHTLPVFVGKRGLTCRQSIRLGLTDLSARVSSSVCNLVRWGPIPVPLPA